VLIAATIAGAACRKPPAGASGAAGQASPAGAVPSGAPPSGPAPSGAPPSGLPPSGPPPSGLPTIKPMPAQLPDVVARVNGEPVTKVDLDRLVKNMELSAKQPVPPERRDEILRQALDQLVTYTVLSQETRSRKVTVSESDIEGNVKQMRSSFPNEAEFTKALEARGLSIERLRADTRVDISINKMMEAELAGQPLPSDAQVREFYDKNPDRFQTARASHILFKFDEKADEAAKKKLLAEAQAVLAQVKRGADFAALAKKHSDDGSAQQGGDLGVFNKGQMVPPFDAAVFSMKPGQLSDIVTTQFGYHIIKVAERAAVPFEKVSPKIKEFLTEQQKRDRAQAFIESLKQKARIEVLV
jgi:peptidyl-prolyl cis-trans isomerase C